MGKFKVGDKVKSLDLYCITNGMEGEIVEVNIKGVCPYLVYFKGWGKGHNGSGYSKKIYDTDDYYWLRDEDLQLVKQQKQTFIGKMETSEPMKGTAEWKVEGFKKEIDKVNHRTILYYRNGSIITCVVKRGPYKGVGIAKCHPCDDFDMYKGILLAELRARENFYKDVACGYAKGI